VFFANLAQKTREYVLCLGVGTALLIEEPMPTIKTLFNKSCAGLSTRVIGQCHSREVPSTGTYPLGSLPALRCWLPQGIPGSSVGATRPNKRPPIEFTRRSFRRGICVNEVVISRR